MNPFRGFSLLEVLMALALLSGTSLVLLSEQAYLMQYSRQIQLHSQARHLLANLSECLKYKTWTHCKMEVLAGENAVESFKFSIEPHPPGMLTVRWFVGSKEKILQQSWAV